MATAGCVKKCSLLEWLTTILGTYAIAALIFAFYFFVDLPGTKIIRKRIYLKKLRKQLDPLATAIGAEVSVIHYGEISRLFYTFPDESYIGLSVSIYGCDVHDVESSRKPDYEKRADGFELLERAIEKIRTSGSGG